MSDPRAVSRRRRGPMVMLARVLRLDDSDLQVYERPAAIGEWAISGAFAFSNWGEADLIGKRRQAFAHGFLGLESFGRATMVAIAPITERERDAAEARLADHFVADYGAPDRDAALPVAREEIRHMVELAEDFEENTILMVERALEEVGVRERFRAVAPRQADLAQFPKG